MGCTLMLDDTIRVGIDPPQLEDFYDALFVNATADERGKYFIALRAFYDGAGNKNFST